LDIRKRIDTVEGPGSCVVNVMQSPVIERAERQLPSCDFGEQAYSFGHGCLERSAMRRMCKAMRRQCLTEREKMGAHGPFETDVMATKRPAMVHVAIDGCERERKDAPYQRVVKDRDVVGNCQEPFLPRFVLCPGLDEVEKSGQAIDFRFVEAEKE
jgi:hypothetical protein